MKFEEKKDPKQNKIAIKKIRIKLEKLKNYRG